MYRCGCCLYVRSNPGRESANKEEPFLRWLTDLADDNNPPLVHSVSYGDMEEW